MSYKPVRTVSEVFICFGFYAAFDQLIKLFYVKPLKSEQSKSIAVEHEVISSSIDDGFTNQCGRLGLRAVKSADAGEFFHRVGAGELHIRDEEVPLVEFDSDPTDFDEKYSVVSASERERLRSFSISEKSILGLLDLQAQYCAKNEEVDQHFVNCLAMVDLSVENRIRSVIADYSPGVIVGVFVMSAFYRKILFSRLHKFNPPFRAFNPFITAVGLLGIFPLITLSDWLQIKRPFSSRVAQMMLEDDAENQGTPPSQTSLPDLYNQASDETRELVDWILDDGSELIPFYGDIMERCTPRSMACVGFWRPLCDAFVFFGRLLPTLRSFLPPVTAHAITLTSMVTHRLLYSNEDIITFSEKLPPLDAIVNYVASGVWCQAMMMMGAGRWGAIACYTIENSYRGFVRWMRTEDNQVRYFLPWVEGCDTSFVTAMAASHEVAPRKEKPEGAIDRATLKAFAADIVASFSSDTLATKRMKPQDMVDFVAALDCSITAIGKTSRYSTLRSLCLDLFDHPHSSPERREMSELHASLAALKMAIALVYEVVPPKQEFGIEDVVVVLEDAVERWGLTVNDLQHMKSTLQQWDNPDLEKVLDLIQGYHDSQLEGITKALQVYGMELYRRFCLALGGRAVVLKHEDERYRKLMMKIISFGDTASLSRYLFSNGLTASRFARIVEQWSLKSREVKELDEKWKQFKQSSSFQKFLDDKIANGQPRRIREYQNPTVR